MFSLQNVSHFSYLSVPRDMTFWRQQQHTVHSSSVAENTAELATPIKTNKMALSSISLWKAGWVPGTDGEWTSTFFWTWYDWSSLLDSIPPQCAESKALPVCALLWGVIVCDSVPLQCCFETFVSPNICSPLCPFFVKIKRLNNTKKDFEVNQHCEHRHKGGSY